MNLGVVDESEQIQIGQRVDRWCHRDVGDDIVCAVVALFDSSIHPTQPGSQKFSPAELGVTVCVPTGLVK